jgi:hypothetical protein
MIPHLGISKQKQKENIMKRFIMGILIITLIISAISLTLNLELQRSDYFSDSFYIITDRMPPEMSYALMEEAYMPYSIDPHYYLYCSDQYDRYKEALLKYRPSLFNN